MGTIATKPCGESDRLVRGSIGPGHIVFFVVAAAAPLTAVVGASPPAFAFGNGSGVPGAYVLAGILYLIFSAGFTALCRHIRTTGGFYVYIGEGLGRPAGIAGAAIAISTYTALQVAVLALAGVFLSATLTPIGLALPWWIFAAALLALSTAAGRRDIGFSGNILGACMLAEVAILLVLDVGILARGGGPQGLSLSGFAPAEVFVPGLGAAMVFVIGSFMGFEATVLFAEETAEPERAIPRATYAAVLVITCFYAFSAWAIAQHYGPDRVGAAAADGLDTLFFRAADGVLGGWASQTMRGLLIVSLFACCLSLHGTINRYLLALARDGLLPRALARLHPRHRSPSVAGVTQAGTALVVVAVFAAAHLDPYAIVFSWTSAFATLGILVVQLLVCLAVIVFFQRHPSPFGSWRTLVAPLVAGVGLGVVLALVIVNLPLIAGSDSPVPAGLPFAVVTIGILGAALGWRRRDPRGHRHGAAGVIPE